MTVRYVISREEHRELCRPYFPASNWASSVTNVSVAAGLVILAIGILAGNRQAAVAALVLVLIAVVRFAAALFQPTVGTLVRRYRYAKRVHALYRETLQGREREFSFDENSWSSQDEAGGAVAWSDLTQAIEYENVIWLRSGDKYAFVPKNALSPENLSLLRRLAIGEFLAPMKIRVGLKEHLLVEIPSLWRRRKSEMLRAHVLGILAAVALAIWLWREHKPEDAPWILALCGALLFIALSTQFWYHLAVFVTQSTFHTYWQIECSERGAHIKWKTSECFLAWPGFPKFREIGSAFLLYIDRTQYYILPKRSLSRQEEERLRHVLQTKLPVADAWA